MEMPTQRERIDYILSKVGRRIHTPHPSPPPSS
jgi:hypothetical protein